jgi:ribosome-associated protein
MGQFRVSLEHLENEMVFTAAFSSGAGGQSVNRTESKAVASWNLANSNLFSMDERLRLLSKLQNKLNSEGEIVISSQVHRSQQMNKKECVQKLAELLQQSLFVPKRRIKTKPSKSSQKKRVESKKLRGKVKSLRQNRSGWDD